MQQATLLAPASPSVSLVNDRPATTSLEVAKFFGKRHDNVVRDIESIATQLPENFLQLNFEETAYQQETPMGVKQSRMFILFRDGFMLLVMGYTGKKAMQIKIAYIEAFNQMEAQLHAPTAQPALPSTVTPSTAADRRPLTNLVKVWARQANMYQSQAWYMLNGHFNITSVTKIPLESIPAAIAFVEGKINALAKLAAKEEQKALPEAAQLPALSKKDLPSTARLFEDIRKAEKILEGTENWTHIKVRLELCREVDLYTFERSVDMHINAAWYALGLAKSSLLAALTVGRISKEFTPTGSARV